jgi:hypothetical protein
MKQKENIEIDFVILYEDTATALTREIKNKLKEGYELCGGLVISPGPWFHQAMIKKGK